VLTGSPDDEFVNHWSPTGEQHIKSIYNFKPRDVPSFVTELNSTSLYLTRCFFDETTRQLRAPSFGGANQIVVLLKKYHNAVAAVVRSTYVELWNVVNDEFLGRMNEETKVIVELNDGNLVTSSFPYKLCIWSTESCQLLQTLEGHSLTVRGLVCLDNGILVSCSDDKTVKMWDTELGCCVATLCGHTKPVISIVKLSNGTIVTASIDNTMRGWNDKGHTLFIAQTEMPVVSLCELEDGTVAGGVYGCIERWRLPTHE